MAKDKETLLIYDLETNAIDPNVAVPQLMGCKSSISDEFVWTSNIDEMVALINGADIIVGYNNKEYDDVIMTRYGANFRGKVNIDLMQIIHGKGFGNDLGRKGIITTRDGTHLGTILHGKSLADTTRALGGPLKIGDFDYDLFKHKFGTLTEEQQKLALEYLEADIEATQYIYEYLEEYFANFKDGGITIDGEFRPFMRDDQIQKKQYLTASTAAWTYKAICNLAGLEEKYNNAEHEGYGGGFVALPTQEYAKGDIYCLDYNSLYPHIMIQANLYGPQREIDNGFHLRGMSETTGTYNCKTLAPVGRVLKELYAKRLEYKKEKDAKEYTIKIIINTIYGLLGNPAFASVYNHTAAADCTRLGRSWVNAARLHFKEHGYTVLYTDTDSVYLLDPFHDKDRLLAVKDKHINDIKRTVPFPQDTFDMGIDDEIRYMAFFKGSGGNFLKKNYLYVTKDGKLKLKGLPIVKSTSTKLGRVIFDKHIAPLIINENVHKVQRKDLDKWVEEELAADLSVASVFYKVRDLAEYNSMTSIQAQVAKAKGPGQYNLLKLKREHQKGIGGGRNYLDVNDAEGLRISALDLSKTWAELGHFIATEQKTLEAFW